MSNHYIVIGTEPSGDIRHRTESTFPKNVTGDFVLWDGDANASDINNMCKALFPYFRRLVAFKGKEVGKCIFDSGNVFYRATTKQCPNCKVYVTQNTLDKFDGVCADCQP